MTCLTACAEGGGWVSGEISIRRFGLPGLISYRVERSLRNPTIFVGFREGWIALNPTEDTVGIGFPVK